MNKLNRLERFLSMFNSVRPGEGYSIVVHGLYIFLIIVCYYLLKNIREAFILVEFSAEVRAYAVGLIAFVLFLILPIYNYIFNRTNRIQLIRWITLFFISNILIFYLLYLCKFNVGFIFFIWVGIFGVLMIAQFWAFASDSYNQKSGQRLFPIIMIGASLGGVVGPVLTKWLVNFQGTDIVLLVAAGLLGITLFFTRTARTLIPPASLCIDCHTLKSKYQSIFGGTAMVFKKEYLLLIAIFVVILNCINSTGEYILSKLIFTQAEEMVTTVANRSRELSRYIIELYGNFYFWVNVCGFFIQAFLVGRIYSFIGIGYSTLIMPVFVILGYSIVGFFPIFTIIYLFKIFENAIDYSVMNTTRHALFLPLTQEEKYHGKTAIDTFFWRFGDVVQAGVVYGGVRFFDFGMSEFVLLNIGLSVIWIIVGIKIYKLYKSQKKQNREDELIAKNSSDRVDCKDELIF